MSRKVRILSLDGGGIRGVIPAAIMDYVEGRIIELTGNEHARIADCFDMIVGTSTGGILACYYLMPNTDNKRFTGEAPMSMFRASDALNMYMKYGSKIFNEAKKNNFLGIGKIFNASAYSPKNLEEIFSDKFGSVAYNQLRKRCIITGYEMKKQKAFFFNNREVGEKERMERNFLVRDVARSTSAAPTYFPSAIIRSQTVYKNAKESEQYVFVDGGVFANNPAMCAYAEARATTFNKEIDGFDCEKPSAKDMLMLSIGTGSQELKLKDVMKSGSWGLLDWATSIADIMMDGSLDTVNYQTKLLFETLEGDNKNNFLRVDVASSDRNYNSEMTDASSENLEKLRKAGQNTVTKNKEKLDEFIKKLIEQDPRTTVKKAQSDDLENNEPPLA